MPRLPRASGLLLHPTSLPGPYGIGDLGTGADQFLEFLDHAQQSLWQVLPLTPTGFGDSPYAAPSAFAGNPLLIAFEPLLGRGLLHPDELRPLEQLPQNRIDFGRLAPLKHEVLQLAFQRFKRQADQAWKDRVAAFCREEAHWLDDFALFTALQEEHPEAANWAEWEPALRDRDPEALRVARERLAARIEYHAFTQCAFFQQWGKLRREAHGRGIRIVGDIPIFVAYDSADVWAHRELFKLDRQGRPRVVAGVPPDYFSKTGQLWGNPLYDWDTLATLGYPWWVERFRHLLRQVDVVRIDHFRGFEAAWEIPVQAETAVEGEWVKGPGTAVFRAVGNALGEGVPVIAEDLGLITNAVRELLAVLGFPGMKVLQFAFDDGPDNAYLPHNFEDPNCVVYTGTHDNDSTCGWYLSTPEHKRDFVRRYLGRSGDDVAWDFMRLASASVADTFIAPVQDVLGLGAESRMNTPGASEGNWRWRVPPDALQPEIAYRLAELTWLYDRAPKERND